LIVILHECSPLLRFGATPEDEPEIDDDEFERIRSRLGSGSAGKRSSGKAKKK
jgi:hypothetical protein